MRLVNQKSTLVKLSSVIATLPGILLFFFGIEKNSFIFILFSLPLIMLFATNFIYYFRKKREDAVYYFILVSCAFALSFLFLYYNYKLLIY